MTPVNDLMSHEESEDCVCGPDVHFEAGGKVVVHHSLDGRENRENVAVEYGKTALALTGFAAVLWLIWQLGDLWRG